MRVCVFGLSSSQLLDVCSLSSCARLPTNSSRARPVIISFFHSHVLFVFLSLNPCSYFFAFTLFLPLPDATVLRQAARLHACLGRAQGHSDAPRVARARAVGHQGQFGRLGCVRCMVCFSAPIGEISFENKLLVAATHPIKRNMDRSPAMSLWSCFFRAPCMNFPSDLLDFLFI